MKRILIITYYWPPAGGIGVHRCLKIAKYLSRMGWEPVIYTAQSPQYASIDNTNIDQIPADIEVIKRPFFEPYRLFKRLTGRGEKDSANPVYVRDKKRSLLDSFSIWIRGNVFIPDARAFWIRPSVRYLVKYLRKHPVEAIFTDGPPHTNTMIGLRLSQKTGIPWVADFQDPWTQVDYYSMLKISPIADKIHKRLEKQVFKYADKITIASPSWALDLEEIGASNVSVLYWGYDEDDFKNPKPEPDKKFSITHAGLLGFDRSPQTLLAVLNDLCKESEEFFRLLHINLIGNVDYTIIETIKKLGLENNAFLPGNIDRPQVLNYEFSSHILLLPLNKAKNAKGRIPGKLFEYLRTQRPILALGPRDSDVAQIIKDSIAGETFDYDDYDGLKKFILKRFELFKAGKNNLSQNLVAIEKYNSENLVKELNEYLHEIIQK